METILFIIISLIALISALLVVTRRDPITSVLFLIVTFFCLAVLYVMLGAQFIAAMQVIVYAGAIMVLFIFVVMMLNLSGSQKWEIIGPVRKILGFVAAAGVLLITVMLLRQSLGLAADLDPSMGTVAAIGETLFQRYLLPFEIASVLLLAAIIGVVAIVRHNPLPEENREGGKE